MRIEARDGLHAVRIRTPLKKTQNNRMPASLRLLLVVLTLAASPPAIPNHNHMSPRQGDGLHSATILVSRHAEKPAKKKKGGPGLAAAGDARAQAYADYFRHFSIDGQKVKLDTLIATADTRHSDRPRETLELLSRAIKVPIQQPFADDEVKDLAGWLADGSANRGILIAWPQGKIP